MFLEEKNRFVEPAARGEVDLLILWLEKMPANGEYNYGCNNHCLICQFFDATGVPYKRVAASYYRLPSGNEAPLPASFNDIAVKYPRTFGAALTRARTLRPA